MSDELERAKRAFKAQEPIRPDSEARRAAIGAAMAEFEKKNATASQGSEAEDRLMVSSGTSPAASRWRRIMTSFIPRQFGVVAGGVGLATLLVVTLNSGNLQDLLGSGSFGPTIHSSNEATQPKTITLDDMESVGGQAADKSEEIYVRQSADAVNEIAEVLQELEVSAGDTRDTTRARGDFDGESRAMASAKPVAPAAVPMAPAAPLAVKRNLSGANDSVRNRGTVFVSEPHETSRQFSVAPGGDVSQTFYQDQGRDKFTDITANPQKLVSEAPVSTFSVDVDSASYAFVRSELNRGVLPQSDAVRVEEMINYFDYAYPVPADRSVPFNADIAIMPTPWNADTILLRIGIKGFDLPKDEAPAANLVFLVDTSGSMNAPDKLPLLRNAFRLLVSSLKPDDTVAIVAYAGSVGTVLEPTKISEQAKILSALDNLSSGGSTAGAEGIRQAYQLAESTFDKDGVNRVILATDGDFNVGITDVEELKSFVERKRETGISLSVLGFGHGNYNDELMQTLAQNGNGNAAYIDTLNEARKTLVTEAGSTLFTIAKDVKIQLEFNPAAIREYRLIGYETRLLNREDFNNDKVDAGDIGAGHSVTALYELTPVGSGAGLVDDLRYKSAVTSATSGQSDEYGFLKIRYKQPGSDTSELIEVPINGDVEVAEIDRASEDTRFAASVAAFGQILRGGRYTGAYSLDDVAALAQSAKGDDPYGYRGEFITLVELAKSGQALQPLKQ